MSSSILQKERNYNCYFWNTYVPTNLFVLWVLSKKTYKGYIRYVNAVNNFLIIDCNKLLKLKERGMNARECVLARVEMMFIFGGTCHNSVKRSLFKLSISTSSNKVWDLIRSHDVSTIKVKKEKTEKNNQKEWKK